MPRAWRPTSGTERDGDSDLTEFFAGPRESRKGAEQAMQLLGRRLSS